MKIENAHMPFVAPDAENRPARFCCRPIGGVWKLHRLESGEWVRVETGLPADVTECAPTAEYSDGEWRLSFIAGSGGELRENRLYRMHGFTGVPEAVAAADVGFCREGWTVHGTRRGPVVIDNGNWRKSLTVGGWRYYYRVSYNPDEPAKLLLSGQRFDGEIMSIEYDLHSGRLWLLETADHQALYKAALWRGTACFAEQTGPGFEDRSLVELDAAEWRRTELPVSLAELTRLDPATMDCLACLRKHLSKALSYGKEILSGHGDGAELDHRADFAGELENAEDHAARMEGVTYAPRLRKLRHKLDEQQWTPTGADLDLLRRMWQSSMGITRCACRKG